MFESFEVMLSNEILLRSKVKRLLDDASFRNTITFGKSRGSFANHFFPFFLFGNKRGFMPSLSWLSATAI